MKVMFIHDLVIGSVVDFLSHAMWLNCPLSPFLLYLCLLFHLLLLYFLFLKMCLIQFYCFFFNSIVDIIFTKIYEHINWNTINSQETTCDTADKNQTLTTGFYNVYFLLTIFHYHHHSNLPCRYTFVPIYHHIFIYLEMFINSVVHLIRYPIRYPPLCNYPVFFHNVPLSLLSKIFLVVIVCSFFFFINKSLIDWFFLLLYIIVSLLCF